MRNRRHCLSVLLLLAAGAAAAQPPGAARESGPPLRANQIVGLWQVQVSLRPCANPAAPGISFSAFNAYHAGGTLSDTNFNPPTTRGPGMGIWSHLGDRRYQTRFQFARYLDGTFDGLQDVATVLTLEPGGDYYTSEVHALALNADGSVRAALCGSAEGERVGLE